MNPIALIRNAHAADSLQYIVKYLIRLIAVFILKYKQEFLSAPAADFSFLFHRLQKNFCQFFQHHIPGIMPVGIVCLFEKIDVADCN